MRLREAKLLKTGDLVTAPNVGIYHPVSVVRVTESENPRIKLLVTLLDRGANRDFNYKHIRRTA